MNSTSLPTEFGSHCVTPDQIFPELEWANRGSISRELVHIFKVLTVSDTWVAIRDNGDFTSCHNSIRGDWKGDTTCKIVLIMETFDYFGSIRGCCRLAFYSETEWSQQVERFLADQREKRRQDPKALVKGRMPDRDPVIGVECLTGVEREGSNNEFRLRWENPQFGYLLQQVRDRLVAAGYSQL